MASAAAGPARPGEGQPAIVQIPLDNLIPSPFNARKHFDRQALAELAASIRTDGIIEPLIVRKKAEGKDYEIISGERRFRAAELAELKAVPCIVREADEARARRLQIIENLQREGIAPLEEAESFQDLLKAQAVFGGTAPTVEGIAKELGKSKEYVYGRLKLLKLGKAAKKSLELGRITAGHAVELVPLDEAKQEEALDYLEADAGNDGVTHTSVMELREEIKYQINPPPKPKPDAGQAARDKKFREQQAKQQAQWKKQEEARRRQTQRGQRIQNAALTRLWPQLAKWSPEDLTRILIREEVDHIEGIGEAQLLAAGKPLPDNMHIITHANEKALLARPLPEQLALLVMAIAISRVGYAPEDNADLYKRAKIDPKEIAADIQAQEKVAAAKALLGRPLTEQPASEAAKARRVLSTSAKSQSKPKAKAKHAAKPRKASKKTGKK